MTERRPGPDHALYGHSPLPNRVPLRWPNGARVALVVFLYFEYWELDPPNGWIYDKRHDGALGGVFPNYKVHAQYMATASASSACSICSIATSCR